jgi:hypothetical protein
LVSWVAYVDISKRRDSSDWIGRIGSIDRLKANIELEMELGRPSRLLQPGTSTQLRWLATAHRQFSQ